MWVILDYPKNKNITDNPFKGGIDSCSTAVLVYSMCRMVCSAIRENNEEVIADVYKILNRYGASEQLPKTPEQFCSRLQSLFL